MLRRWLAAFWSFIMDTVRLQNYCSIPYLMIINSLFCIVCFWCTREVQLHTLYGLIGLLFCSDLFLIRQQQNPLLLAFLYWFFHDFLRSFSICLFAFSVYALNEGHERKAFVGSLFAVSSLVLSPIYHHQKVGEKLIQLASRALQAGKHFLSRFVLRPLFFLWNWLKYLVLLRWLSVIGFHLRSWILVVWDWLDANVFAPIGSFGRKVRELLLYVLLFRWCIDLWRIVRRILFKPIGVQLMRLLDAFIYVFGCYWLKPLLLHLIRAIGRMTKATLHKLGQLSLSFAALTFEHVLWPLLLIIVDQFELVGLFLHEKAIKPVLALLYRKYKLLEDLMLIHVLGPVLKTLLNWLPQKNPLEVESDHELDDFLPDVEMEDGEGAVTGEHDTTLTAEICEYSLMPGTAEHSEPTSGRRSSLSSLFSLEDEAKALASGLRRIDVGESDSDTELFLPSLRRNQ